MSPRQIFFHISFRLGCLTRGLNRGLTFNKLIHYLLDYSDFIHTYIIGHYNSSVRIKIQLLTPLMLCALILYMSAGTFSIKSTSNDRFWRSFPWQFYLLGDHNEPNCKWGFRLLVSFTVFPSKYWIRLRASVFFTLS